MVKFKFWVELIQKQKSRNGHMEFWISTTPHLAPQFLDQSSTKSVLKFQQKIWIGPFNKKINRSRLNLSKIRIYQHQTKILCIPVYCKYYKPLVGLKAAIIASIDLMAFFGLVAEPFAAP